MQSFFDGMAFFFGADDNPMKNTTVKEKQKTKAYKAGKLTLVI